MDSRALTNKDTFLAVVGCGGIAFHGIPGLVNWLERRGPGRTRVLLFDPDRIERDNRTRQWAYHLLGAAKVEAMTSALTELIGADLHIDAQAEMATRNSIVEAVAKAVIQSERKSQDIRGVVIASMPDNHTARIEADEAARQLVRDLEVKVLSLTAGNNLTRGYACGSWYRPDQELYGWPELHPDIREEAEREREGSRGRQSCGGLEQRDSLEQSAGANAKTAALLWDLASKLWEGRDRLTGGEMYWRMSQTEEHLREGTLKTGALTQHLFPLQGR